LENNLEIRVENRAIYRLSTV